MYLRVCLSQRFPFGSRFPALAELRLSNNRLMDLGDGVSRMPSLKILDLGHNLLSTAQSEFHLDPIRNAPPTQLYRQIVELEVYGFGLRVGWCRALKALGPALKLTQLNFLGNPAMESAGVNS